MLLLVLCPGLFPLFHIQLLVHVLDEKIGITEVSHPTNKGENDQLSWEEKN